MPEHIVACGVGRPWTPSTDLVITHGGHGTVSAALRHGVPVLCMPMGRDQREVAGSAVWQGAGIGTKVDTPTARLRRLIRMALSEPSLRVAAGQLAARMAADDRDIAVRELEHIATSVRSTVTD